jgi:hypothetical protein
MLLLARPTFSGLIRALAVRPDYPSEDSNLVSARVTDKGKHEGKKRRSGKHTTTRLRGGCA